MTDLLSSATYVVVANRSWNRRTFNERIRQFPGRWVYVDDANQLTPASLRELAPRYVFFLHWSATVPAEIVDAYECVGFHMTDLPYGRGGSPLQNLILRKHRSTKLTAFRMTSEIDAGPVYGKEDLSLGGTAAEILGRASALSAGMIERIIHERPDPVPQQGEVDVFRRRTPADSRIEGIEGLEALYDFVRMLDGEGYPRAFLEHDGFRFELHGARLRDDRLEAELIISRSEDLE